MVTWLVGLMFMAYLYFKPHSSPAVSGDPAVTSQTGMAGFRAARDAMLRTTQA